MHSLPGFCRLRMHSKGPHPGSIPVAFVEFKNAACAGSAMVNLQGRYLLSSDRGSIRIEYAKSKMAADAAAAVAAAASTGNHQHFIWREVRVFLMWDGHIIFVFRFNFLLLEGFNGNVIECVTRLHLMS